jgi:site-specific DNA-adenine methylase
MTRLLPFFTYYGGKFRVAPKYPEPDYMQIVEPFAGSAGYSLAHPDHEVRLVDLDENIVQTWAYLLGATEREIAALPDIKADQTVDDLGVCPEARLLIGWWLNKGSAQPKRKPSSFMVKYPEGGPYWGQRVRDRIVGQLEHIRHWTVEQGSYIDVEHHGSTWFIDPPYVGAGHHYRHGSRDIDYAHLADWCRSRPGQVIVCEADSADWLPFEPLAVIDGTEGRQKTSKARVEVMWTTALPQCPGCGYGHDVTSCVGDCDCCEAMGA